MLHIFCKDLMHKKLGYTVIYEFLIKISLRISFWWKKVSQDGGALYFLKPRMLFSWHEIVFILTDILKFECMYSRKNLIYFKSLQFKEFVLYSRQKSILVKGKLYIV